MVAKIEPAELATVEYLLSASSGHPMSTFHQIYFRILFFNKILISFT